uniref:Cytochrome-c peroxidase n=1 Tax=uncultured organism TaxID=155900 RepID=E3T322_9ZZZZ|nr:cytochrome-c peroxidase [uncultured organism]
MSVMPNPSQPVPLHIKLDSRKILLGKKLFHDTRLSASGKSSCATCHDVGKGGEDGIKFAVNDDGSLRQRNSQTVLNVGLQYIFNWDGSFTSLQAQAMSVLENLMQTDWSAVTRQFDKETVYHNAFTGIYEEGITPETIVDAIAVYEMSLITPNGRFDRYLRGDKEAITLQEKRGYKLFKRYGCISCHQGVNVGGNMFARLGVMGDYFEDRGHETTADLGRYNVTRREADKYRFKVPSLRNVALTAPYLHDASADGLEDAIEIMAKYQLGKVIS